MSASEAIRRSEAHFDGAGGRRLFGRRWEAPEPTRALVLVHGYAEHSGRYDHVGAWFAARGAAVHGFDHQGHGLSQGPRCHVRRFDDFLDDLDVVVGNARDAHPELPLFVVGHSMGGLITCAWARERRPDVRGLVISAPALSTSAVSPTKLLLLRALRTFLPKLSIPSDLDPDALSRDPSVVQAYLADPLIHLKMTLSLGAEMFGAMERTAPGGADVELPLLMLHGLEDPLCSPEASRVFTEAAPHGRYQGYAGLRHEIFNEPEQETIFADVQAWLATIEEGKSIPRA